VTNITAGKQKGRPPGRASGRSDSTNRSGSTPNTRKDIESSRASLIEELLQPYVLYKNPANGEWRVRCPFHYDVEGDGSINPGKRVYICFRCVGRSFSEVVECLLAREANGFVPAWLMEPLRTGCRSSSFSRPTGPPSAPVLAAWHKHLLLPRNADRLAYLTGPSRLLTVETVERFEIGWSEEFEFYSIPIYDRSGELYTFNRYRLNRKPKMLCRRGDHVTLYPWSVLEKVRKGDLLVVCEGHWDALLLNQLGVPAITGGGANVWKPEWSVVLRNLGARVVVIYDCDESGRAGRRKPLSGIPGSRAIDLAPSRTDGYDVTAYLRTHTVDQLLGAVR
jgi:DNA primase